MQTHRTTRVALVVPHIYMNQKILPDVIFSPAELAITLANGLAEYDVDVTLFSPGPVKTSVKNITADLSLFEAELAGRGDTYADLLKKHPFTFVTLARQVQAELISAAYTAANSGEYDIVHVYTNEEDIAMQFAGLCMVPMVFTHHDPFNFLVKYKAIFPKFTNLNWISISMSQRQTMPTDTNWVGNVYHGINPGDYSVIESNMVEPYVAYCGRIVEPKGVHLAIKAVQKYNQENNTKLRLKIAGKHYGGAGKDSYWHDVIEPMLGDDIEYVGFISDKNMKNEFLGRATALMMPSVFDEPFGLVMIEALSSGTPIIGLNSGAIPEVVDEKTGIVVEKYTDENKVVADMVVAISEIGKLSSADCRARFIENFTAKKMCQNYSQIYHKTI